MSIIIKIRPKTLLSHSNKRDEKEKGCHFGD